MTIKSEDLKTKDWELCRRYINDDNRSFTSTNATFADTGFIESLLVNASGQPVGFHTDNAVVQPGLECEGDSDRSFTFRVAFVFADPRFLMARQAASPG